MGLGLAESTGHALDPFFITPRLWGIADSGPWMHDGRAVTITEAINMHGDFFSEALTSALAFNTLSESEKLDLLAFLRTLRTPRNPSIDLLKGDNDD